MAMTWYEIKSQTEEARTKVFKSIRGQKLMVRKVNGRLVTCIGSQHQGWLSDVCRDFGSVLTVLDGPPDGVTALSKEEYKAPCGEIFYDPRLVATHQKYCSECRKAKALSVPTSTKRTSAHTVAKLEPGQDLDINGVITSLQVMKSRLEEKLVLVDSLVENLKGFMDSKDMMDELDVEVKQRVAAVKLLMDDGKIK